MKNRAILVVSFGTTYPQTLEETIGAIEREIEKAYPEYFVRRCFTSGIVRKVLYQREGLQIDDVPGALERLLEEGVTEVAVQPTHVMHGFEYDKLQSQAAAFTGRFPRLSLGRPLLSSTADYQEVVQALRSEFADPLADPQAALVLMGHGTEHFANACYAALNDHVRAAGVRNLFVGAVEGYPEVDDLLIRIKESGAKRVALAPLMVVAGDHARNDMAGAGPDSWKSRLESAGYPVTCILKGLGSYRTIRQIYLSHLREIL